MPQLHTRLLLAPDIPDCLVELAGRFSEAAAC